MSTIALWYTARATGVISLVLLTIVVALGIAAAPGEAPSACPRFAVALVHRNAALLAVVTLVIHITTLLLDSYAKVHVTDLLVPFVGPYRPFWQGLGTVGLELILALVATGLLRTRMPERVWRGVHWLAYVAWPVAFAHGLGTGTDSGAGGMRAIAGCSRTHRAGRHRLAARPALHRTQQSAPAAHPAVGAGPGKDPMNAATARPPTPSRTWLPSHRRAARLLAAAARDLRSHQALLGPLPWTGECGATDHAARRLRADRPRRRRLPVGAQAGGRRSR